MTFYKTIYINILDKFPVSAEQNRKHLMAEKFCMSPVKTAGNLSVQKNPENLERMIKHERQLTGKRCNRSERP